MRKSDLIQILENIAGDPKILLCTDWFEENFSGVEGFLDTDAIYWQPQGTWELIDPEDREEYANDPVEPVVILWPETLDPYA